MQLETKGGDREATPLYILQTSTDICLSRSSSQIECINGHYIRSVICFESTIDYVTGDRITENVLIKTILDIVSNSLSMYPCLAPHPHTKVCEKHDSMIALLPDYFTLLRILTGGTTPK